MSEIQKRDYQERVISECYNSWSQGIKNNIIVLPTGGGKSVVMSQIILDSYNQGMSQAVVAHRNELVSQMSIHVANRHIPHRIIASKQTISQITAKHREEFGRSFVNPSAPTAVVGVDTLMARKDDLSGWARQIDQWMIDECHHTILGNNPNKWGKATEMFVNARGLGVTATPQRADGQGLGREYDGVFDQMIVGPSMRELINREYLSDYEIICPESDLNVDDSPLSKDGDYSNQTLRKAAKKSHIVGDVVETYFKNALGRSAIVFATDVETANEMARKFNEWGISAASLNGKTNPTVRDKYIKEFKSGKCRVLVNVDLFDEGFDVPSCDVVIMARPTASLGKYLQMVGRGLRYMPDKLALIIDHVSNVVRHGLPDKKHVWTLARREKKSKQAPDPEEIKLRKCHQCTRPYLPFLLSCPHCGAEKPLPSSNERSIEMVEGDLVLLDRETLARMRAMTEPENPADVANRVASVAGKAAGQHQAKKQIEKIEAHNRLKNAIAQWAAIKRDEGRSDREIQKMFYLTMGVDVVSILDASQKRVDLEKLAEIVEGWYLK